MSRKTLMVELGIVGVRVRAKCTVAEEKSRDVGRNAIELVCFETKRSGSIWTIARKQN